MTKHLLIVNEIIVYVFLENAFNKAMHTRKTEIIYNSTRTMHTNIA